MNRLHFVSGMVTAVFMLTFSPAWAQSKDPALDKLLADFSAAFGRADAKALASLFTADAVRLTPGGTAVGSAAIEKQFSADLAGIFKGGKIKIVPGTTTAISADIKVNEGAYEVSSMKGADGKPIPPLSGRYVNTLVKKGGGYLIASNAVSRTAQAAR